MDDGLYILSKYITGKNDSLQAIRNLQGISNILTSLASPFSCTATIRGTINESSREAECGWLIRGKFGNRMRTMRIDSIQYDEAGGTFVIHAVHNDLWVMSHRIGTDMTKVIELGFLGIDASKTLRKNFTAMVEHLCEFLKGDCEPPRITEHLESWPVTAVEMIAIPHLASVLEEMGHVISLYRPAWEAGEVALPEELAKERGQSTAENVVFSTSRPYILSSAAGMCRVISTGKEYAPNFGYGSGGGKAWATAELQGAPITYGGYYERIYDAHDVYIAENLRKTTEGLLQQDADSAVWWEIEVINTCGQDIWIGDTISGEFSGSRPVTVVSIDYEQTGTATRTYMRLGRLPVTVAERLRMLRLTQSREREKFDILNAPTPLSDWMEKIGLK